MLGNIGGAELILIMMVILLVFGAKRIPEIARGLGQGIREFKKAASEVSRELKLEEDAARRAAPPHPTVPQEPIAQRRPAGSSSEPASTPAP